MAVSTLGSGLIFVFLTFPSFCFGDHAAGMQIDCGAFLLWSVFVFDLGDANHGLWRFQTDFRSLNGLENSCVSLFSTFIHTWWSAGGLCFLNSNTSFKIQQKFKTLILFTFNYFPTLTPPKPRNSFWPKFV